MGERNFPKEQEGPRAAACGTLLPSSAAGLAEQTGSSSHGATQSGQNGTGRAEPLGLGSTSTVGAWLDACKAGMMVLQG